MFVELHFIQNFAPANLNRDDANLPKDTDFGGARRARISSQCFKRAIRTDPIFSATTEVSNGTRTRFVVRALRQRLMNADKSEEDATGVATTFADAYSGGMDAKRPAQTKVMLYLSAQEVDWVVDQLLAKWDEALAAAADGGSADQNETGKKKGRKSKAEAANPASDIVEELVKQTKERTSAPDIALFGRMLADRPETNIDAACQVAHAISTHAVKMDIDYFTAMEELAEPHETGASQIGASGFNSACFYRYLRVDWDLLLKNLGGDEDLARKTVKGLMLAAEAAIPTGKQNSHAAHNRPSFMLAAVRDDGAGWSLVNAFEKPVRANRDSGLVGPSIERLDRYWRNLTRFYGEDSVKAKAATFGADLAADEVELSEALKAALVSTRDEWISKIVAQLSLSGAAS